MGWRARLLLASARAARELTRQGGPAGTLVRTVRIEPLPAGAASLEPRFGDSFLREATYCGLWLASLATPVAIANLELDLYFHDRGWLAWLKLLSGTVLAGEGLLLATNWRRARWLVLRHIHARANARAAGPHRLWSPLRWRLLALLLAGLGIAWLAGGLLELARGVAGLA